MFAFFSGSCYIRIILESRDLYMLDKAAKYNRLIKYTRICMIN